MGSQTEFTRRYQILLEAARCLSCVMDLNGLLEEILNRAQEVTHSEGCSILLPEAGGKELILLSTTQEIRSLKTAPRVPMEQSIAGEVFRTRQLLNLRDAHLDPRHYDKIDRQVGLVTHALLSVPLLERDRCLGVLQALNPIDAEYFDAEAEVILQAFGAMIASALVRLEAQKREVERARSQQEMSLAREIQESFLPPATRTFPFCQIHMRSFPARNVGGDFCFLDEVGPGRLLMGLGDVAGKGVPAALTMARATAMIHARADHLTLDLADWVRQLNWQLCKDLKAGHFIGITFLLVDLHTSSLRICSSGQFRPVRLTAGHWQVAPAEPQAALGIISDFPYTAEVAPLVPGEFWLLFTDGITEARNGAGVEWTEQGLRDALLEGQPGKKVFQTVLSRWREFTGTASQHDDASLLLLDWRGSPPPASVEIRCCPETLCSGRQFVERWAILAGYDDVTVGQIVTACDEAASNVFRHAYEGQPGPLTIAASITQKDLVFEVTDQAKPVAREAIRGRDLSNLRPGGLGTVILRKIFDSVDYQPQPKGNRLTLRKRLPN